MRTCATILLFCCLPLVQLAAGEFSVDAAAKDFLAANCMDCHQGQDAEAGLDLTDLPTASSDEAAFDKWVHIVERVQSGEMPPRDYDQPTAESRSRFVKKTSAPLIAHQRQQHEKFGRVRGRRLTNLQLERTLQDLLGIDIPLASRMPEELRTYGYTTVAAGQSISHFQLEDHLKVVDVALDEAFRRALSEPDEWSKRLSAEQVARRLKQRRCREPEMLDGKAVVWSSRLIFYGRLPVTTARQDGWYRLKIKASALNVPEDHGVWCTVRTGKCVSSAPMLAWAGAFEATREPQEWTFEAWLSEGDMFEVRPGDATLKMGRFQGGQVGVGEGTPQNLCGLATHEVELERIHKGLDDQQIRQWLFGDLKVQPDRKRMAGTVVSDSPQQDAAALIKQFAARAFRRPVADDVVAPYIAMAKQSLADGDSLMESLRGTYRAILCSPRFLHFYEEPGQLDDFALAARLSYLLWGTMPDDELMSLATAGKLHQPAELNRQIERLLQHSRGQNFVKDFAHQWLDLSEIDFTEPDRKLYPGFDVIVQQSMLDETHTFLQTMLDQDLSVGNLIDTDFTFLNSRLARYYDIKGVEGDELRQVSLKPDHKRGGLVTQGAIMKVTANGTTTSPVIRGVWVSERLLGVDIPPPPKNVSAIEPDIRGAKTIREQLAKHKSSPDCASCHVKIDPPGFALENFDPSGRWRNFYPAVAKGRRSKGPKIDVEFDMPDGRHFDTLPQFQKLVLDNKSALAANFARQLVAYGTGATCSFADQEVINQIVTQSEEADYGLRSIVAATVTSSLFKTK